MPDQRRHRGPHPEDLRLFAPACWPILQQATADLCWLASRGYPRSSAVKLVGDRYGLVARQRIAVARSACSETERAERQARRVAPNAVAGRPLWLDGYNVLTTVEAALAGGIILAARDGAYRDMASMHGSFRRVAETQPALELLGSHCADLKVAQCIWCLDRPVSNSGRLRKLMTELAAARGWRWQVELVADPDRLLTAAQPAGAVVASADSVVLDRCGPWFNLARETIVRHVADARVVDLAGE
ncbi:MAG: DUF434 domain-containing protein [Thermoguttaceae bacterium]